MQSTRAPAEPTDPEPLQLLTLEEAAKLLAVSRSTVYQLMGGGQLPSIKVGRARRVRRAALQELIDQSTHGPADCSNRL